LATAANLFATQPFHKVRLDDVAAAAGVGKGTLYIYFKSKEDLYFSILYGGFARLVDGLKQQLQDDHSPAWQRLTRVVEGMVDFAFEHPELWELMRTVGAPALGDADWDHKRREFTELVEHVIADGVRSGELHDPNPLLTALYIPGLVRSAMLYGPKGLQRDSLVAHIVTLLEHGLRHSVESAARTSA